MVETVLLTPPSAEKTTKKHKFVFSCLTIQGKRNAKTKILANKRDRSLWWDIYRRKRVMSSYFSETAFGSESDTKKQLYNLHEDDSLLRKYRVWLITDSGGLYDENENENQIAIMGMPKNSTYQKQKEAQE